jgi:hypothetical protein
VGDGTAVEVEAQMRWSSQPHREEWKWVVGSSWELDPSKQNALEAFGYLDSKKSNRLQANDPPSR